MTKRADDGEATRPAMGSIVIPAHNESAVIGRCLATLYEGLGSLEAQVVVVANGCTDDTVDVARRAAPRALVLDIDTASKPAAIRAGESAASALPRIYLDADVLMSGNAVRATLTALAAGVVAARPPLMYDTTGTSWPVRSYYRARTAMPSLHRHAWGAGVYGLSAEARGRFSGFPDVVGDDLFVDRLLGPGELEIIDTDPVCVSTPRDSRMLLRVLRRAQRTKRDTEPAVEAAAPATAGAALKDLWEVARSGRTGPVDAFVYAAFAVAARSGRGRQAGVSRWERDESSRR